MNAVEMQCITKRFGTVVANDCVDLCVERGTMYAIVGENGAGKTTLMRVLYGISRPDSGSIKINGKEAEFAAPKDALAAGIGMVSQHYAIIPELTCLDNLILGSEGSLLIRRQDAKQRASELAHELGFAFDWDAEASTLSPAGCQKLEVLKLLWRGAEIMILDEPTAMLSPEDAESLFSNLGTLTKAGKTILLVTHRLSEVMQNCKRALVMRGGKKVADVEVAGASTDELARWIVGEQLDPQPITAPPIGPVSFAFDQVTVRGERGNIAAENCSLEVGAGELVGIAGVDGSGQRELVRAIFGLAPYSGSVKVGGVSVDRLSPAGRLALGLRLIPEDRREEGVILDWPLQDNAILGMQRSQELTRGPLLERNKEKAIASTVLERFRTKAESVRAPMASLSGGNQQRFVAGRALFGSPKVLVAFQPTRGLDIRGSREVFDSIREECGKGMAALIISYDLDELLDNCNRIVVMFAGRLSFPPPEVARDRRAIGRLMVGLSP